MSGMYVDIDLRSDVIDFSTGCCARRWTLLNEIDDDGAVADTPRIPTNAAQIRSWANPWLDRTLTLASGQPIHQAYTISITLDRHIYRYNIRNLVQLRYRNVRSISSPDSVNLITTALQWEKNTIIFPQYINCRLVIFFYLISDHIYAWEGHEFNQ